MRKHWILCVVIVLLLSACSNGNVKTEKLGENSPAYFEWFDYQGDDAVFREPLAKDEYQNPILAGFHPDPSVVRVGNDFYMVNSTFGFFPGIPIFHSQDLVHWSQIGNVIHRPEQLSFDGLSLVYNGVYAPAIEHKDGIFYVINTCVACGGNFVVTATNPAGPWSDPIWLPHIQGIDPSIYFDDNGKTYIVHHRDPLGKRYPAHTALWLMEVDLQNNFAPLSDDVMLVDGGEPAPWHTEYIEGPHLYKVNGMYYLSAPGGGTGYFHGQLVYRAKEIFGPYEAYRNNPVLTQWGLPDDRPNPVTATGHGDMVEDKNGDWWMVFLGTRVYDLNTPPQDPGNFHTGRETFMLPVTWKNGWPIVLEKGEILPYRVKKPNLTTRTSVGSTTGNFSVREMFSEAELGPEWLFVRTPRTRWWQLSENGLAIQPRAERIGDKKQPSFIGRRLAHMKASFGTKLRFEPSNNSEAGLLALQTDNNFYAFGLSLNVQNKPILQVRKKSGKNDNQYGEVVAETVLSLEPGSPVYLKMAIDKARLDFYYSLNGDHYQTVLTNADAKVLTTQSAGGFVGAIVGMFAEQK